MSKAEPAKIKGKILIARSRDISIPVFSPSLRAVLALCGDRYVSADKISTVILADYGLTFRLFRLMNSAFFSVRRKDLLSLKYMVVLLGLENLAKAIVKVNVFIPERTPSARVDPSVFYIAQGLLSSSVAGLLAEAAGFDSEKTSVMAMFRNLGDVISAISIPEITSACLQGPFIDYGRFRSRCSGFTPETLAYQLSMYWNLPRLVRLVICPQRFNFKEINSEDSKLVLVSDTVNLLIRAVLLQRKGMKDFQEAKKQLASILNMDEKTIAAVVSSAVSNFYQGQAFFARVLESVSPLNKLING